MPQLPVHLTPDRWLDQIFASQEAQRGGVVKRKVRDVERLVGRDALVQAAARRGFQVVENHHHFVIFCNGQPIRRVR